MDRTVPKTDSEEIELYMRTYYSLLRSSHSIQIETLVESHTAMESSLHVGARSPDCDVSALVYSSLRLPTVMPEVEYVLLGQIERSFQERGYDVPAWQRVSAPGRRRRTHFDGAETLAVFIASRSDIDDLIPMLTAYQIEWNKLHHRLQGETARQFLSDAAERRDPLTDAEAVMLASELNLSASELRRIELVWGARFFTTLNRIAKARKQLSIRQFAGSLSDYRRGTGSWWADLQAELGDVVQLDSRPVYFVSSNTHSLVNLITGFARREEDALAGYIREREHTNLLAEYAALRQDSARGLDNFLYYVLKKYLADVSAPREQLLLDEAAIGIRRIASRHGFDIETQVIEIGKLRADWLDPRLTHDLNPYALAGSDAIILNIDYPLGLAAYELLARVTEHVSPLLGVYVMGKAATLNGRVGDVMIPNVVHDEHSENTYLFNNCFQARDLAPFLMHGMVLDNQKAVTALGTFLQNPRYMGVFYREGYTDIEMEAGPYLSSIYEAVRPLRHPKNEIVNLYGAPFDIGFLHYASDTPLSKGHNLGASNLSYAGVEPTYATAVAILRRIIRRESERMNMRAEAQTLSIRNGIYSADLT